MSCRDCVHYNGCNILAKRIENWETWDDETIFESTSDLIDDIEENMPDLCGKYAEKRND